MSVGNYINTRKSLGHVWIDPPEVTEGSESSLESTTTATRLGGGGTGSLLDRSCQEPPKHVSKRVHFEFGTATELENKRRAALIARGNACGNSIGVSSSSDGSSTENSSATRGSSRSSTTSKSGGSSTATESDKSESDTDKSSTSGKSESDKSSTSGKSDLEQNPIDKETSEMSLSGEKFASNDSGASDLLLDFVNDERDECFAM